MSLQGAGCDLEGESLPTQMGPQRPEEKQPNGQEEKPFQCSMGGKSLRKRRSLTSHQRIPLGGGNHLNAWSVDSSRDFCSSWMPWTDASSHSCTFKSDVSGPSSWRGFMDTSSQPFTSSLEALLIRDAMSHSARESLDGLEEASVRLSREAIPGYFAWILWMSWLWDSAQKLSAIPSSVYMAALEASFLQEFLSCLPVL